jgi:SAM-dependent methyltransferase
VIELAQRPQRTEGRQQTDFILVCPDCRAGVSVDAHSARCDLCRREYVRRDGIWRFLAPTRAEAYEPFLRDYRIVRAAEGWGARDAQYYRALPNVGAHVPQRAIWNVRAKHFEWLLHIIAARPAARILDVGAGNGWLAHQLAARAHRVAALDLADDARDGLGAHVHYPTRFECYQAEFDRLPFANSQFDWVIFNASLHYARELDTTLREARRVLRDGGAMVIMDSPFYARAADGRKMVAAREAEFRAQFGFSRDVDAVGFMTLETLAASAARAELQIRVAHADAHLAARAKRVWQRVRVGRAPARFPLILLEK